jgi:hypothetical protein
MGAKKYTFVASGAGKCRERGERKEGERGGRERGGGWEREGSDSMLTIFGSAERRNRHRAICSHLFFYKYAYNFWICRKASSAQSCRAVWSCALADLMATDTLSVDITSPVYCLWFMV